MLRNKLVPPNVLDPLSEPTPNRRVWGSYIQAGFTRRTFAEALGVRYSQVNQWDGDHQEISLPHFVRIVETVRLYGLQDYVFGYDRPKLVGGPTPGSLMPMDPRVHTSEALAKRWATAFGDAVMRCPWDPSLAFRVANAAVHHAVNAL